MGQVFDVPDAIVVEFKLLKKCTVLESLNLLNQVLAKSKKLKQNIELAKNMGHLP